MKLNKLLQWFITMLVVLTGFCAPLQASPHSDSMDQVAEDYIRLGLALREHDSQPSYYIGPPEIQQQVKQNLLSLDVITTELDRLQGRVGALPTPHSPLDRQRLEAMQERLLAMRVRLGIIRGKPPASFDDEVEQMYGVRIKRWTEAEFTQLIDQLEELIPGEGELSQRIEQFRNLFVIPVDKLEAVMGAALEECRQQTRARLTFIGPEQTQLQLVTDKPWVGFLHYLGQGNSLVLLNKDVPIHLERAIELGCHEAYPGHHAHATMIDHTLVQGYGWQEYTLIPLYGPQALIAEGVASYAEDLVFTPDERSDFEVNTLIPLAGLDASQMDIYNRYRAIAYQLRYAWGEVARRFLYEGMPRSEALAWLKKYGLETEETAIQRLNFISALRAYVVTYSHGRDLVKRYIEHHSQGDEATKWRLYQQLISTPVLPANIELEH